MAGNAAALRRTHKGRSHVSDERHHPADREDKTKEFEELFEKEQYPNWRKHKKDGGFLAASLTRVEFGSEEDDAKRGKYVNYVVVAKVRDMRAHTKHDSDPDFQAYDKKADAFQPEGPSVWGGTTLFEI